jgi:purine-nucleoside phosphorylase
MSVSKQLDETVLAIQARTRGTPFETPRVGLVLGSGLGAFADDFDGPKIPYAEIPHMPVSRVVGHAGKLCFGRVGARGIPVVCMQGRVHFYEGHALDAVVHGARTMARLGASIVLLTNAAGGCDPSFHAGDLMIVTDHLNLTTRSPLIGDNDDALGPRFPDMTAAYDPAIQSALRAAGHALGIELREGVYAWLTGPSYETPAEIRMLRTLGANAVGMSTVPEVLALRHMGARVGALSCITNLAAGLSSAPLDHKEVEETARSRRADLLRLLAAWIEGVAT